MNEAVETVEVIAPQEEGEEPGIRFTYSRPEQPWLNRLVIRGIERMSGQPYLENLYRRWSAGAKGGEGFFAAAARLLDVSAETDAAAWARVPRDGPVLFVANHPFGVVDGLLLGHLATAVRPDTKIITHSLLCQAPEAREHLLPVDFGGTPQAAQTSAMTRRRAVEWLRMGHAIAVFPAGSVSTAQRPFRGPALDAAWHPFAAKLALQPGVTTVPVCFHGQNSRLFQIASHIHYALRIALLFRESRRRVGTRIKVSVGAPITAEDLLACGSRLDAVQELRRRTLSLLGPGAPDPRQEFCWPAHIKVD